MKRKMSGDKIVPQREEGPGGPSVRRFDQEQEPPRKNRPSHLPQKIGKAVQLALVFSEAVGHRDNIVAIG
jgi:hypothetical protein